MQLPARKGDTPAPAADALGMPGSIPFIQTMAVLAPLIGFVSPVVALADPAANKHLVEKALTELFVNRDVSALKRYWGDPYIQHNPGFPNGTAGLAGLIGNLPPGFKYEMGMAVADGDLVVVHGRYTGVAPKPQISIDIFRLVNGKIGEHWDVWQDETPAGETKSGNAMFKPGM